VRFLDSSLKITLEEKKNFRKKIFKFFSCYWEPPDLNIVSFFLFTLSIFSGVFEIQSIYFEEEEEDSLEEKVDNTLQQIVSKRMGRSFDTSMAVDSSVRCCILRENST
jgi:hypothetical protein